MSMDTFAADVETMKRDGLLAEIVGELKSGKEATVHLARNPDGELFALKHYRPVHGKRFITTAKYRNGRFLKERDARAFHKRTKYGRRLAHATWIASEFAAMRRAQRAGVRVPRPIALVGASILMEYIPETPGSEAPAPRLIDVEVPPAEAKRLHATLMRAVITMMEHHLVHADLSPFNVLLPASRAWRPQSRFNGIEVPFPGPGHAGSTPSFHTEDDRARGRAGSPGASRWEPVIIDFPQAVDPRRNREALDLLRHDVEQITRHFQPIDETISDRNLAERLWGRFLEGRM